MGTLTLEWENPDTFSITNFLAEMNGLTQGLLQRRFPVQAEQIRFVDRARGSLPPLGGRAKLTGTGLDTLWKSPNIIVKLERVEVTGTLNGYKTTQVIPVNAARLYGNQAIEFFQPPPAYAAIRLTALCLPSSVSTAAQLVGFPHMWLWIDYAVAEMYKASQEQGPLSDEQELLSLYQYWKQLADDRKFEILSALGYEQTDTKAKPKAKAR